MPETNCSTLFIDLDDTVYAASSGLWGEIRHRIELYMDERLHIEPEKIPELRVSLYSHYGTSMRGLVALYQIDEQDYLDYVHDVPLKSYIMPDMNLRRVLLALPQRKVIFTNADANHAHRVLTHLKIDDCFEQVIDIRDVSPYCKPQVEAFKIALQKVSEDSSCCALVDDSLPNLNTARQLGMYTVHVGEHEVNGDGHSHIHYLRDLPQVFGLR